MLALKTVLARADQTPTLIFDEIDQGIGGRVGAVVGRKLWGLTAIAIRRAKRPSAIRSFASRTCRSWRVTATRIFASRKASPKVAQRRTSSRWTTSCAWRNWRRCSALRAKAQCRARRKSSRRWPRKRAAADQRSTAKLVIFESRKDDKRPDDSFVDYGIAFRTPLSNLFTSIIFDRCHSCNLSPRRL